METRPKWRGPARHRIADPLALLLRALVLLRQFEGRFEITATLVLGQVNHGIHRRSKRDLLPSVPAQLLSTIDYGDGAGIS
jgi:hypothetical protein